MRLACGAGLQTGKLWRAAARERHNQRACKAAPAAGHGTQSGACGAPASTAPAARSERAERRLRWATARRAAPAAGYALWSAERRRLRRATLHAERRLRRAGAWRAGEPQSAQRDACTGPQHTERRLRRMGWRAGEQQKAQSGACGGQRVQLAEWRPRRAIRRTERRCGG